MLAGFDCYSLSKRPSLIKFQMILALRRSCGHVLKYPLYYMEDHSLPPSAAKEEKLKLLIVVSKTLALRAALAPFSW